MSRALILFDVDGTLLVTGGASSRCILRAGQKVLGDRFNWGSVVVGRLDPEIFLDLAAQSGIIDAQIKLEAYKACYLEELEADLKRNRPSIRVMPGITSALAELNRRSDVGVGLLTGNFREAVRLKLDAAQIDPSCFAVQACAEDGTSRHDLVAAALHQEAKISGKGLRPEQVILIGDTPRDIECARRTGARVLAVATGRYTLEQLRAEGPDQAVKDLSDLRPLLDLINHVHESTSQISSKPLA